LPAWSLKTRKILICIAITIFWLVMSAKLVRREILLPGVPSGRFGIAATLAPGVPFKEQWMGIYYEDQKVGYSNTIVSKVGGTEAPGYTIRNNTYMVVSLLDTPLKVHFDGILRTDEDFKMRDFRSTLKSAGHKIRIDGRMEGDALFLEILSGGRVFKKKEIVGSDMNLSNSLTPLLYLPNLEVGVTYSLNILDPLSFSTKKAKVTVKGMEPLEYQGKLVDTYVVETEYGGLIFTAWVTEGGDVLKEATPMGWTLIREDRKVAEDFRTDANEFRRDITKLATVSSDVRIDDPQNTYMTEIFISGIDLDLFELEGAGQSLIDPEKGLVRIEARRPDPAKVLDLPITDENFAKFLTSSLLVQSDDPEIMKLAARIAGEEKNSLAVAERINEWVFDNVEKKITFSLPSAVEVLETLEGDCNEHTALFVGLARAAGIPTRTAIGLVYHRGRFYYHAWPEVYVGEWTKMDPTFGQAVADATHVKLLEGEFEQQAKLTLALGKIKLNIKSYSYPPPDKPVAETSGEAKETQEAKEEGS
jgi:hypothetical protein